MLQLSAIDTSTLELLKKLMSFDEFTCPSGQAGEFETGWWANLNNQLASEYKNKTSYLGLWVLKHYFSNFGKNKNT